MAEIAADEGPSSSMEAEELQLSLSTNRVAIIDTDAVARLDINLGLIKPDRATARLLAADGSVTTIDLGNGPRGPVVILPPQQVGLRVVQVFNCLTVFSIHRLRCRGLMCVCGTAAGRRRRRGVPRTSFMYDHVQ